ncbi:hypothetical protein CAPTEDRAFT_195022 [Capitella teleta]|uniref:Uncharacterized protein n=1 Tax=Capitella teleta TaxID=283909 RepID=R7U395_CAPTE|nr:hypothetical protein CAPTEDRAFT_195022 [Capitella teleta]|eukprot:ELU00591.1 hypothetical protein CAPTEDRAFT_195022 [Capitella teleta]
MAQALMSERLKRKDLSHIEILCVYLSCNRVTVEPREFTDTCHLTCKLSNNPGPPKLDTSHFQAGQVLGCHLLIQWAGTRGCFSDTFGGSVLYYENLMKDFIHSNIPLPRPRYLLCTTNPIPVQDNPGNASRHSWLKTSTEYIIKQYQHTHNSTTTITEHINNFHDT